MYGIELTIEEVLQKKSPKREKTCTYVDIEW